MRSSSRHSRATLSRSWRWSPVAVHGDRAAIDRHHVVARCACGRGEQRSPAGASVRAADDHEPGCGRGDRLADPCRDRVVDHEVGEVGAIGVERGELGELRIDPGLAVREREHAARDLERLALLGDVGRAIGPLDQPERAQRALWSELAPRSQRGGGTVDDTTQRIRT